MLQSLDEYRFHLNIKLKLIDGIPLEGWDMQPYPGQEQVALCHCGASSNKPFCDEGHAKARFEATERAP